MIKDIEIFDNVITDYIVGMPSGEVIDVTSDEFIKLKKGKLIKYHKPKKYFMFIDENYTNIKKILNRDPNKIQFIHYFMDQINVTKYKINDDLSVDCDENVDISKRGLVRIPIKFGQINGNFDCSMNNITNLVNSPVAITGHFDCSLNRIYTLIGGPRYVAGGYYCSDNNLEDLMGFPDYCQVVFDASRNNLKRLSGCPNRIEARFFDISYNRLTSLSDGPLKTANYDCSHNFIVSLSNGVKEVSGKFTCTHNRLFDLMGMPSCNKIIFEDGNEIDEIDHD